MAVPHSQHLGVWGRARLLLPPRPRGIWGAPENLPLPPPPNQLAQQVAVCP